MARPLRILHVWNTAGVASVIARHMDRRWGTQSAVMTRKAYDPAGVTTYGVAYDDLGPVFRLRVLRSAARADIVHVHSMDTMIPLVRAAHPGVPVVMHYHGTDIRGRWKSRRRLWNAASFVAYSTPDLGEGAPEEAVHVPNPVDTNIFYPRQVARAPQSALYFRYGMDDAAAKWANALSLSLTTVERNSIPHESMPEVFSQFSYYFDLRRVRGARQVAALGKGALEALACGAKVVNWKGEVVEALPPEHLPENVADRWMSIYNGMLD